MPPPLAPGDQPGNSEEGRPLGVGEGANFLRCSPRRADWTRTHLDVVTGSYKRNLFLFKQLRNQIIVITIRIEATNVRAYNAFFVYNH